MLTHIKHELGWAQSKILLAIIITSCAYVIFSGRTHKMLAGATLGIEEGLCGRKDLLCILYLCEQFKIFIRGSFYFYLKIS